MKSRTLQPFRDLLESVPDAMVVADQGRVVVLVNSQTEKLFGFSRGELLGKHVEALIPERYRGGHVQHCRAFFTAPLLRPMGLGLELYGLRKDGTEFPVDIRFSPLETEEGMYVTAAIRDISDRKRGEVQIHKLSLELQAKEQLQLLLDSTAEAIYAIDLNGACTLCNAACLRLLGYGHESELLGKDMHTTMHHTRPDGGPYPVAECKIYQAFQGGKRGHVTDEVLWRADGTSFPAEYWSYPIKHEERIVGGVVTFLDITERKRVEEQLRRSESRYRSIIQSAPYGVYRVDQNGRITMANPTFATMLGYQSPDELLDLNTGTDVYLTPAEQQRARDYASEVPKLGYEAKWKRKDGKTIIVRLAGRRLPDEDELPGGFEVFAEDITEQRSLQKQFEHAQKMEAVGRLAGGVAHDFNNLLMVISGYALLLNESAADREKVLKYAAQIRDSSSKAATITRQLLAFSRREVLEPIVLDLNSVVKDLGKMLQRLLGEDVEIAMSLEPHLGTLRADRGQLEQVMMNLAVNARDAMPKGGRLTIETANLTLDTAYHQRTEVSVPPGRYVLLAVSDTGVGMDTETQLHIFEPFFTTKEEGKGTGLGLATVYGIVKQSHGFIWVYSDLGKGSTFKIYLPRLDATAEEHGMQPLQPTPGGTETILLVEDEDTLRNVSRVYLESKGYTVLDAASAKDALGLCKSHQKPIHLLITDMVMPGLGGLDLAKSVLELRQGVAVVLVSGYTDRTAGTEAAGIGAKFLQKPFSLDGLARTIRASLSRNRQILLIEDSKFMRVAVARALTAAGYIVSTAIDGEEGCRIAGEAPPDLILLDMMLPNTPSLETLHALRTDPVAKDTPVVILAAGSPADRNKLLDAGATAYLEKSDTLENDSTALLETVGRVLAKATASHT